MASIDYTSMHTDIHVASIDYTSMHTEIHVASIDYTSMHTDIHVAYRNMYYECLTSSRTNL